MRAVDATDATTRVVDTIGVASGTTVGIMGATINSIDVTASAAGAMGNTTTGATEGDGP